MKMEEQNTKMKEQNIKLKEQNIQLEEQKNNQRNVYCLYRSCLLLI